MLIVFEGPDMTGKTQIAKAFAKAMRADYFKNTGEWTTDLRSPEYFKNLLRFGGTFLLDFLSQVKTKTVFDRFYPSELAYANVFGRDTDRDIIRKMDEKFASIGGCIVVCRRKSYKGIKDDLHDYVDSSVLERLDAEYATFAEQSKCPVHTLWVDDENLDREVMEVLDWYLRTMNNFG